MKEHTYPCKRTASAAMCIHESRSLSAALSAPGVDGGVKPRVPPELVSFINISAVTFAEDARFPFNCIGVLGRFDFAVMEELYVVKQAF